MLSYFNFTYMTQQEFEIQLKQITDQSHALLEQKVSLERRYIEENRPFNIGDKVKITNRYNEIEYGFVSGFYLHYSEIRPHLLKMKSDGKPSLHRLDPGFGYTLELVP